MYPKQPIYDNEHSLELSSIIFPPIHHLVGKFSLITKVDGMLEMDRYGPQSCKSVTMLIM